MRRTIPVAFMVFLLRSAAEPAAFFVSFHLYYPQDLEAYSISAAGFLCQQFAKQGGVRPAPPFPAPPFQLLRPILCKSIQFPL